MRFLLSILIALLLLPSASAFALSSEQKGAISQNCNAIKTSLSSLQKTDSKTRVLLGTSYQAVLANFLTPLNIRLVKANRSDANLSTTQANIASEWSTFQEQFIKYSQSLESLIAIDCKNNPDDFYTSLEQTRSYRKSLDKTAIKINKLINSSVNTVTSLRDSLSQKSENQNGSL